MTQTWLFLPRFGSFPCIVASLLLLSRVLEKLIFTILLIFSLLFWRSRFSEVLTLTSGIFDSASAIFAGMYILVSLPSAVCHQCSFVIRLLFFFLFPD